ncbi:hypothetical protein [uncultured Pseudokineococcus sp.]|uniref:hypothetical protein n=1 Tax=uncultured Pseudokineococcus sp. TaxID=1642928 RepID=UPI0026261F11|nr:hypothetical protein [uncultured Pseudokineococcus sp.]
MPLLRPAPDRLGPDGQPLPVTTPPRDHPSASADDLAAGVVLVGLSVAAAIATWVLHGKVWFFLLVLVVGLVGVLLLARGVHRLASGADQLLRQCLGPAPSRAEAPRPWEPAEPDEPR